MSFDAATIMSFIGGDTSDLVAIVNKYDPEKKSRRALDGLEPVHARLALCVIFVETLTSFLEQISTRLNHTVFLRRLYERCLKTKKDTGAELLSSTFSIKSSDLASFFDDSKSKKKPDLEEENGDDDEDDWLIIPDPKADAVLAQTDPQKLALKIKRRKLKMEQMHLRYKLCRAWVMCFWEQLGTPEFQEMIRNRNEDLFLKPEVYKRIKWFEDSNWIAGLEIDEKGNRIIARDVDGNELSPDSYPHTTKEAYEEIVIVDQLEQQAVEEERAESKKDIPDAKPLRNEIWYRLNNALLLAEIEAKIDDASIASVLQFIRDLYDDIEQGKVAKIPDIQQLILQKIQTTMPMFDTNSSMRLFDFILEAVFQNVKPFRDAFRAAKEFIPASMIPSGVLDLASSYASNYGLDLKTLDVDQFVDSQVNHLARVRQTRQQLANSNLVISTAEQNNTANQQKQTKN